MEKQPKRANNKPKRANNQPTCTFQTACMIHAPTFPEPLALKSLALALIQ